MSINRFLEESRRYFHASPDDGDMGGVQEGTPEPTSESISEGGQETPQAWPDTWREQIAGDNEKELNQLGRYATPADIWKKARALEQRISSGEYKQVTDFPSEGSDEEKAAWRTNNGIPEAPDKYDLSFNDGLVIGDDDKPIIDEFLQAAHEANMPEPMVKTAISWYYDNQEKIAEARNEADLELRETVEDELRSEWGNEYRANINRINGLLDTAPEGVKEKIMNARFQDGTPLASDADTLRYLIDLALQINPATTLVPGAGDNIHGAISDEIANLESMMGDKNSEYWKGPKADKHQARYRELVDAQNRMKK